MFIRPELGGKVQDVYFSLHTVGQSGQRLLFVVCNLSLPLHARIQKVLSEGGPTLTMFFFFFHFFLFDEGREDPYTTISEQSSARQRNTI